MRAFHKIPIFISVIFASTLLGLTIGLVHASWSEPPAPPPQGNIDAPLNISPLIQRKTGGLILGGITEVGLGVNEASMSVFGGPVCMGSPDPATCRTANYGNGSQLEGGGLDITFAGNPPSYPSTLILGADLIGRVTRTNLQPKAFWISMPPYSMGNLFTTVMGGFNDNSGNEIDIGGGGSNLAAATQISFFTAPTQNVTYGSLASKINSNGVFSALRGFVLEVRNTNPASPETGRMWLCNPSCP